MAAAALILGLGFALPCIAFDNSRYDNVAVYWGQNSYGATHSDVVNFQKPINYYCQDDAIDVIPVAFVNTFFGPGGVPVLNLANTCNNVDNATFPGTSLANCAALAADIEFCQSKGKIVTLSLGGAGGTVGFQSDAQAQSFADQIWNLFLGGSSSTRPFGNAVLDGVDLDIESGGSTGYAAFVTQIRSHASGASKQYYVTAAPQCVYPDSALGGVINAVGFDAIYVQFYNNPCGLQNFNSASNWDFGLWDNWARTISPNKNVKIYIGAPASSTASGSGYQSPSTLASIATTMRKSFPSFGGVMLWDASQAYVNGRYDAAIKNALVAAGGTGFTFPTCTAPAFASGGNYPGGSTVSYGGYTWQAKWYASSTPANDPNNDWSAISACTGSGGSGSSSGSTSPTGGGGGGSCSNVAPWSSTTVYTGGQQATYGGHLWTANWWTQGDTPGGSAGAWKDNGACASIVVQTVAPYQASSASSATNSASRTSSPTASTVASASRSAESHSATEAVPSATQSSEAGNQPHSSTVSNADGPQATGNASEASHGNATETGSVDSQKSRRSSRFFMV